MITIKPVGRDIPVLSKIAEEIVREHYDPIIGKAQNDYMIEKFQSVPALVDQINHGYEYYLVCHDGAPAGFIGLIVKGDRLYLSKYYLKKSLRGNGYGKQMMDFILSVGKKAGLKSVFLNVNKRNFDSIRIYEHMGFVKIAEEKNDIGNGFFMDDYVYELKIL